MRYNTISGFPTQAVVNEFLAALNAPTYVENPDWYEQINVKQQESMSITVLPTRLLECMPVMAGVLNALDSHGIRLSHLQMFVTRPGNLSRWHIDGNYRHASLNIPVFNCSGVIEWSDPDYAFDTEVFASEYTRNIRASSRLEDEVPVVEQVVLTHTTLVNSGVWHRLDNRKSLTGHRVVLSARFANNPPFVDVLTAFNSIFQ